MLKIKICILKKMCDVEEIHAEEISLNFFQKMGDENLKRELNLLVFALNTLYDIRDEYINRGMYDENVMIELKGTSFFDEFSLTLLEVERREEEERKELLDSDMREELKKLTLRMMLNEENWKSQTKNDEF